MECIICNKEAHHILVCNVEKMIDIYKDKIWPICDECIEEGLYNKKLFKIA